MTKKNRRLEKMKKRVDENARIQAESQAMSRALRHQTARSMAVLAVALMEDSASSRPKPGVSTTVAAPVVDGNGTDKQPSRKDGS